MMTHNKWVLIHFLNLNFWFLTNLICSKVNTADLRYCVGVVLSDGEKPTNEEHLKAYLDRGFKEIRFPAVDHAVLTTFPFSNTLSIFIGVARVYPKIAAYIQVIISRNQPL